ncbi:hypothetical protein [Streptomyces sp. NPDC001108]
MNNSSAINALLTQLAVADRKNRHRGAEGMVRRKEEAVAILRKLNALSPLFRYRLQLEEFQLSAAQSWLRNQESA